MEVQCSKNYFKNLSPQEAGAFGNNTEKELQKPRPKLKKYVYYAFIENICSACNPMQVKVFVEMHQFCRTTTRNFSLSRLHNTLTVKNKEYVF